MQIIQNMLVSKDSTIYSAASPSETVSSLVEEGAVNSPHSDDKRLSQKKKDVAAFVLPPPPSLEVTPRDKGNEPDSSPLSSPCPPSNQLSLLKPLSPTHQDKEVQANAITHKRKRSDPGLLFTTNTGRWSTVHYNVNFSCPNCDAGHSSAFKRRKLGTKRGDTTLWIGKGSEDDPFTLSD